MTVMSFDILLVISFLPMFINMKLVISTFVITENYFKGDIFFNKFYNYILRFFFFLDYALEFPAQGTTDYANIWGMHSLTRFTVFLDEDNYSQCSSIQLRANKCYE